jgi:hypothetical protein
MIVQRIGQRRLNLTRRSLGIGRLTGQQRSQIRRHLGTGPLIDLPTGLMPRRRTIARLTAQ